MIIGVGVDIVHLPRIAALIARRGSDGLARRILSPTEYTEFTAKYKDDPSELRYLGSRWCMKEAVYKALYPVHKLEWKQVSVAKKAGKPYLSILNSDLYGIQKTHVSLSHDGEYAIAQVILEGA
ncbi:4'-phosphopantetheinyl transferase [Mucor lusitanicus]|uniref:4'-phosphopantetheinyl transferase n=1 Tax=Mucor circinelloides f. lusitanicus TaxID=29924 RepID=A0A8H4EXV8_MUCCL|nr:4'-phosphopantetheinyl transferase [Mucor lusitanicus]